MTLEFKVHMCLYYPMKYYPGAVTVKGYYKMHDYSREINDER